MTYNNNRGPYTVEEAKRRTAKNLGCTVEDLDNASRMVREADEKKRRNSRAWKKIDEIIKDLEETYNLSPLNDEGDLLSGISRCIQKLEEFREKEL